MDTVERLRVFIQFEDRDDYQNHIVWKAADEIERLREQLKNSNEIREIIIEERCDALDEIERLRKVNLLQAKWLYKEQQSYKQLQEKVAQWLKEKE